MWWCPSPTEGQGLPSLELTLEIKSTSLKQKIQDHFFVELLALHPRPAAKWSLSCKPRRSLSAFHNSNCRIYLLNIAKKLTEWLMCWFAGFCNVSCQSKIFQRLNIQWNWQLKIDSTKRLVGGQQTRMKWTFCFHPNFWVWCVQVWIC